MFRSLKGVTGLGLMALGLMTATTQANLIPVFEYQFPTSYNGTINSVTDVSGAGNNATIPAGFPLALSSNIPAGEAPGAMSLNLAATPGRVTTSANDLFTATKIANAGGATFDIWFNPTAANFNTTGFHKFIDFAGTFYMSYQTDTAGNNPVLNVSVSNAATTITGFGLDPNGWNHIVLDFDTKGAALTGGSITGELSLLINDTQRFLGTRTISSQGDDLDRPTSIGQHSVGGEQFNGLIYNPATYLGVEGPVLLGHWKLDEKTGGLAADSSGNGFNGAYNGPIQGTPPARPNLGSSADFDGSNDNVTLGGVNAFKMQNDFTIMAWIKPDSVSGIQRIFSSDRPGGYGFGLIGDELRFTTYAVQDYDTSGVDLTTGVFQHVAVVFDSLNDAYFYVNGKLVATVLGVNLANLGNNNFFIGSAGGGEFFNGMIDDVRIYRGALTAAQIFEIASIPEPGSLALLALAGAAMLRRRRGENA